MEGMKTWKIFNDKTNDIENKLSGNVFQSS